MASESGSYDPHEPTTATQWANWVLMGDPAKFVPETLGFLQRRIVQAIVQDRAERDKLEAVGK